MERKSRFDNDSDLEELKKEGVSKLLEIYRPQDRHAKWLVCYASSNAGGEKQAYH